MSERTPDVTELIAARGHEQVVFFADRSVGLRGIIAIHSTALGPSLGGIRFQRYDTERDALVDVLRLSEAMSLKASVAGLHQGGGKAVVLLDDPRAARSEAFLRALGRAVHQLAGRYIAAEDVNATQADMDGIALETPWVTGVDVTRGGSGDPSPVTAIGVLHGMHAVGEAVWDTRDLAGRRVVVQGAGHVGAHLVGLLVEAGASVAVADTDRARVERLVAQYGAGVVETLDVDDAIAAPCDILAPCALGAVLTTTSVERLACAAVCGAANNQLLDDAADEALLARGIVYAPDFVVNAGGIINIAQEWAPGGYSRANALAAAAVIERTTAQVLAAAREQAMPTGRAAVALGRRRIAEAGDRRWSPGDPIPLRPT
ncbi:MAG: Glutamate dehydrogenase/leucine dehydrogenase [Actinomycetia bacterium]|nr:Glutamate dehydrogenase/leucine dehydrogenase [Actinomycetes bacterium]